jgi:ABC-type nitrate/sulfonate/bicarbonate transport system substrate-binding protein
MKYLACRTVLITILLLVVLLIGFEGPSKAESQSQTAPPKLTVGVYPTPYTRLIGIADAKGYFKKCDVEVAVKKYPSGTSALNALLQGEVELCTVVDFRFAWEMLENPSIRAVASTGEVFASRIVARKDRGIRQPSDLKGKRIGYVPNTISEYALGVFLLENGISPSEVTMVPVHLLKQADAVVDGKVDAASAFVTFAFDAVDRLGENGLAWDSKSHTVFNALLVVRKGMIQSPEAIPRFLKALIMAERYSASHADEAKSIIMREWGFSSKIIKIFWDRTNVTVSLNQSIVTSLNIYSKWLMRKRELKGDPPNVLDFIDMGPLDQIDRDRVTIFR